MAGSPLHALPPRLRAGAPWAAAALLAPLLIAALAPGYLTARGFPLDDAWIHAVYGRELARSGALAYNPGAPATGATSLGWAALLALPHALLGAGAVVPAIKAMGLLFHLLAALATARAVARPGDGDEAGAARAGGLLLLLSPPLLAASVSGMEVPLAALAAALLVGAWGRGGPLAYGLAAAAAPLARPELAALALALPLLPRRGAAGGAARAARLWLAGAAGTLLVAGAAAARNLAASGRPLPATFYAKVSTPASVVAGAVARGISRLLGDLPLTGTPLLAAGTALALAALWSRREDAPGAAAGAWAGGLLLCVLSFALVPPIDPLAFYHQRYALPGVALLVAGGPPLAWWALGRLPRPALRRPAALALAAAAALGLALDAPGRLRHLENDARNIDDVQVALGRSLAGASPAEHVWAVDAGAVRYFGGATVVDTMGLNTPEAVGPGAAAWLAERPPRWLEVVGGWSTLALEAGGPLPAAAFEPTTPYTVTGFPGMAAHTLVRCAAPARGTLTVQGRRLSFECPP